MRDPSGRASRPEAIGLTKRVGDVTAVRDLSFTLEAGSVTGLLVGNLLSPGVGTVVLLAWAALFLVAATARTDRPDV